jgi:hypothetical protein
MIHGMAVFIADAKLRKRNGYWITIINITSPPGPLS